MPKTSSTVDVGIRRCPRLYTLCVATQVTCEALGTCTELHRTVTGKEDSRLCPQVLRSLGQEDAEQLLERGGCLLFVIQSRGDSWGVPEVRAQDYVLDCRESNCRD